MPVEKNSSIKDTEPSKTPEDANALLKTNERIWRLKDAVEHWRPGIDSPPFVRRTVNTAINHQSVLLTNAHGVLPARPKEANVKLRNWTSTQCFWTLELTEWTYIVKYYPGNPRLGAHWRCWLGLKDGFDNKPVAVPLRDNDHKPATDASQNRPLAGSNSPSSHNSDVSNLQETVTEEARPDSVNTQSETHDRNERTPTQSRKRVRAVGPHFVDTGPIEREALFATPERQPSRDAAPRKRRATLARVSGVSATSGSHNSSGISPWLSQSSIGAALGVSPAQRLEGITPNPQTTIEHDIMHEKRADKTPVTLSDDDGEEEKVKRQLKYQEREIAILKVQKEILEAERQREQLKEKKAALRAARGKRQLEATKDKMNEEPSH